MSEDFAALSDEEVIGLLPPTSAVKYSQLVELRDDAMGASQFYNEKRRTLYDRCLSLEGELRKLEIESPPGSWSPRMSEPGNPRHPRERIKEQLVEAQAELERITSIAADRSQVFNARGAVTESIKSWFKKCPGDTVFKSYEGPPLKRAVKKPTIDDVERCREDRRGLVVELGKVELAPRPTSELMKLAREKVEALGQRGIPDIMEFIRSGEKISWPTIQLTLGAAAGRGEDTIRGYAGGKTVDVIGLLCWLEPDRLIAALDKEIEALVDDKDALDDKTRAARKSKLLSDVLTLEREEEGLIELAQLHGTTIFRRGDADPRAILNLSSELPGPRLI